jgi:Ni,Fe-hydrogenase III small subunit
MIVLPIKNEETYPWLLEKHYAKRIPQIMFAFGLYDDNQLKGVITYGIPASPSLCMGICGKEYSNRVLELNRLCLMENNKNESSFLVANSIKLLPKPTIVVSYADTSQGHVGYVYQSTNFLYTGLSANRVDWTIKGLEHKHSKTISDGMTLLSIKEKYGDDFYYTERSRKHRYIIFHGSKTDKKIMRSKLMYEVMPYPKGDSKTYNSGGDVKTQGLLFI